MPGKPFSTPTTTVPAMRPTLTILAVALLAAVAFAGCVADDTPDDTDDTEPARGGPVDAAAIEAVIGTPIEQDHDHRDVHDHVGSHNVEFVSWTTLGVELGVNGFANFVFYQDDDEDLAFVAVDGDTTAGFAIVNIAQSEAPEVLGRYMISGNNVQEVRVVPGGEYALMNVQSTPNEGDPDDPYAGCTVCLHVVDVSDRANPEFVSAFPVDLLGTHNMDVRTIGDAIYVFYVGQPLTNHPPGNYVGIARFVEAPQGAHLVKVAEYRHEEAAADEDRSFPHDVLVFDHPLTGQQIAYVSHWGSGAITVDVSNPLAPMELGVHQDPAPSEVSNIHWISQEERDRDGAVYAWSAPEIGQLDSGSGIIRAYDVTDPATIDQVGWWQVPGNLTIPARYIFSPHTTVPDLDRGLLAVTHYHAGVWILDITDPTDLHALGYYSPVGGDDAPYEGEIWWKKPNFSPDGFLPNVYQARWHPDTGLLWVTERGTGLYALDYVGPVPGAVA